MRTTLELTIRRLADGRRSADAAPGGNRPWWQAILWRRADGRLWKEEAPFTSSPWERLRALLHDHSGFIASRLEAFVGRETELAEVRACIAECRERLFADACAIWLHPSSPTSHTL